jgi:predicted phosphodiesterase
MKLALMSDIHANLPALEAVLADLEERSPDQVVCLGDLVGYAPWPDEVISAIRSRGIVTIAGNYDEGVGLNSDDCGCAYQTDEDRARGEESIAFTNGKVSERSRQYLRTLPRHLRLTHVAGRTQGAQPFETLLVHGSPRKINEYLFEDRSDASLLRMMTVADADLLCFGHTHKPYHRALPDPESRWGERHAVNIGSVGKPKDGDPRSCYVILDLDPAREVPVEVEFIRVEYDVERAARAVEESPLPDAFAEALRVAR